MNRRTALFTILLFILGDAMAEAKDSEVESLNARTAVLNAEAALIIARSAREKAEMDALIQRIGAAAEPKTGEINDAEKAIALGDWALSQARTSIAATIAERSATTAGCTNWYITGIADLQRNRLIAEELSRLIQTTTTQLDASVAHLERVTGDSPTPAFVGEVAGVVALISSAVNAIDTVVGLFRSDYSFANYTPTADDLALHLVVAREISKLKPGAFVIVDGLHSIEPSVQSPIIELRNTLAQALNRADAALAKAPAQPPEQLKALLDALKVLTTRGHALDTLINQVPSDGGASILVRAALALSRPKASSCVLMVTHTVTGSALTRKRLMSRNDRITFLIGGVARFAAFDGNGILKSADALPIQQNVSYSLDELANGCTLCARQK